MKRTQVSIKVNPEGQSDVFLLRVVGFVEGKDACTSCQGGQLFYPGDVGFRFQHGGGWGVEKKLH